jgi:hypothetical protein
MGMGWRKKNRWIATDGLRAGRTCAIILGGWLLPSLVYAQQSCAGGMPIDGVVTDPTGAVIRGARVQAAGRAAAVTDASGHYVLPCVPSAATSVTADAEGFARGVAPVHAHGGDAVHVDLRLAVAPVETSVAVNANAAGVDSGDTAGTTVLGTEEVQRLSDDPDDFLRELQALAGGAGGPAGSALVSVDGFQNNSAVPPRSAIASIRIDPDLFSSEYGTPPWLGARIEITTKPGADSWHGALFFVDSDSPFNATDPFSVTATPASKQRYGFELSGPVAGKKTDFFLAIEKRDIQEFSVVNAMTLDGNGNPAPLQQAVGTPQHLWVGSARGDWQISPGDAASLSLSSSVGHLANQGVGGLTLAEAGFDSAASEYDLRLLNTQTLGAHLLHETRISYSWRRTAQTPLSTLPSLLVAGYFTGGGSTGGYRNDRERDLEADDDAIFTRGIHTVKAGVQSLGFFIHDEDPDTFNGAYVFGGGSAPALDANNDPTGQTTTITAIEQYRRTLLNLPGGQPTTFQIDSGTPLVPVTQWQLGAYVQDSAKLSGHLTLTSGLRYQFQTTPGSFANFSPRVGLAWSPDKKSAWVVHLRAGLFFSPVEAAYAMQFDRLNGTRQQEQTVYSPGFQSPLAPVAGAVDVSTVWQMPQAFGQSPSFATQIGVEHEFPHHWQAEVDSNYGANWKQIREENVNAPIVASSVGVAPDPLAAVMAPRPIAPNENIFRYERLAHLRGEFLVSSLRQYSYKRFGFSAFFVHLADVRSDGGFRGSDTTGAANPQSSYSERGESARVDWGTSNLYGVFGNLELPLKAELSTTIDGSGGQPYNLTTGTDANGDGDFNDRPSYASAPGPGVYSTPFGLLTTNTVNGDVPRNLGTMPSQIHIDLNLSRAFTLNPARKDHTRVLTFNARSTNVLNHTNVTAVDTILSSGVVGRPTGAETARRLELGARFTF